MMSEIIHDCIQAKLRLTRMQRLVPRGIYIGYTQIDALRLTDHIQYVNATGELTYYGVPIYQVNTPSHLEVRGTPA